MSGSTTNAFLRLEKTMRDALAVEPWDRSILLEYGDLLEEHGHDVLADKHRVLAEGVCAFGVWCFLVSRAEHTYRLQDVHQHKGAFARWSERQLRDPGKPVLFCDVTDKPARHAFGRESMCGRYPLLTSPVAHRRRCVNFGAGYRGYLLLPQLGAFRDLQALIAQKSPRLQALLPPLEAAQKTEKQP